MGTNANHPYQSGSENMRGFLNPLKSTTSARTNRDQAMLTPILRSARGGGNYIDVNRADLLTEYTGTVADGDEYISRVGVDDDSGESGGSHNGEDDTTMMINVAATTQDYDIIVN